MKAVTIESFQRFEDEFGVFDLRVDGVRFWERIRFQLFRAVNPDTLGKSHSETGSGWRAYAKGGTQWLRNVFIRNPFLASSSDLMFVGSGRRKREPDGQYWDIYCDPIHTACDYDYVHFEQSYQLRHETPAKTENIRYLDLIEFSSTIWNMVRRKPIELTSDERATLEEIDGAIDDRFGVSVDLTNWVRRLLSHRRNKLPLYERLLDRVDPAALVIVTSYGKETLIEAGKNRDIPVIELQHGLLSKRHPGYSFHGDRTKEMFPDYFFTFGEFWKEYVEYPIPDSQVVPIGYPYLERRAGSYADIETRDQILFISQGKIGEELSQFAVELNGQTDHDIVYKLHPGEYDRWRDEYPWLIDSGVTVVDSDEPPLYQLMSESTIQVGVGSTAIFEGLAFDLRTYIVDLPDAQDSEFLIEEEYADLVSTPAELLASADEVASPDLESLFRSNSIQNFEDALEAVVTTDEERPPI